MKILSNQKLQSLIKRPVRKGRHDYTKDSFLNCIVLYQTTLKDSSGNNKYLCQCKCGNFFLASSKNFHKNPNLKCDECKQPIHLGDKFDRLTVSDIIHEDRRSKYICKCQCGNTVKVEGANLIRGLTHSCGCLNSEKASKRFLQDLTGLQFGYLTVLQRADKVGENKNATKWLCRCDGPCHGNLIVVFGGNLRNGYTTSCGCGKSKGEAKISQLLNQKNIQFKQQKTFNSCRFPDSHQLAKFDFYLPTYNILIEYDGIQHFKYRKDFSWNTKENFEKTKKRDNYKNQWCKENNIKLIRIPYTEYDNLNIIIDKIIKSKEIFNE